MLSGLATLWRMQCAALAAMRVAVTDGGWDFDFYGLPDDEPLDDDPLYDELLDVPRGEDVPMTYFVVGPGSRPCVPPSDIEVRWS